MDGAAERVRVAVRFRPENEFSTTVPVADQEPLSVPSPISWDVSRGTVALSIGSTTPPSHPSRMTPTTFQFDRVFGPETTQQGLYESIVTESTRHVLDGFNSAVIAYGQTGSGKTFTMFGPSLTKCQSQQHGMVIRVVEELLRVLRSRQDIAQFAVKCSMMELYHEEVRDLLRSPHDSTDGPLTLREINGEVVVEDLKEIEIRYIGDLYQAINRGRNQRMLACSEAGSQSHALVTLCVTQLLQNNAVLVGKLHLVDLAGSENMGRSGSKGRALRDAQLLHKSISSLGNIMYMLSQQQSQPTAGQPSTHSPRDMVRSSCRDSKLTFLLREALGGNSRVLLLCTCNSRYADVWQTMSTLRFGENARVIRLHPHVNEYSSRDDLLNQVDVLRRQLDVIRAREAELEAEINATADIGDREQYMDDDEDDEKFDALDEGDYDRANGRHAVNIPKEFTDSPGRGDDSGDNGNESPSFSAKGSRVRQSPSDWAVGIGAALPRSKQRVTGLGGLVRNMRRKRKRKYMGMAPGASGPSRRGGWLSGEPAYTDEFLCKVQPPRFRWLFRLLAVLSWATGGLYFWYRITKTINPLYSWFSWMLIVAELYFLFSMIISHLKHWNCINRQTVSFDAMDPLVPEEEFPTVDIFIPTKGEPVDVVERTLQAAMRLKYPPRKLHVYLLDDGNDQDKRDMISKYSAGFACGCGHNSCQYRPNNRPQPRYGALNPFEYYRHSSWLVSDLQNPVSRVPEDRFPSAAALHEVHADPAYVRGSVSPRSGVHDLGANANLQPPQYPYWYDPQQHGLVYSLGSPMEADGMARMEHNAHWLGCQHAGGGHPTSYPEGYYAGPPYDMREGPYPGAECDDMSPPTKLRGGHQRGAQGQDDLPQGAELHVVIEHVAVAGVGLARQRGEVPETSPSNEHFHTWPAVVGNNQRPALSYVARHKPRGMPHHFKAGNLNNGFYNCNHDQRGEFVVFLDCDFAMDERFLLRTLPYFYVWDWKGWRYVLNQVAFVQTPQAFANVPDDDPFGHRNSVFFFVEMSGLDGCSAVPFVGTNAIFRTDALLDIQGIPYGSITEDVFTSLRLSRLGWESVYHAEPLCFGLAPEDISSTLKQRLRWSTGNLQIMKLEGLRGILFSPHLTFWQRIAYFENTTYPFSCFAVLIFIFVAIMFTAFGYSPLAFHVRTLEFALMFLPYFLLTRTAMVVATWNILILDVWRTQQLLFTLMPINFMALWQTWVRKINFFRVTRKDENAQFRRTRLMTPHVITFCLVIAAIIFGPIRYAYSEENALRALYLWLGGTSFCIIILLYIWPIMYLFFARPKLSMYWLQSLVIVCGVIVVGVLVETFQPPD